MMLWYNRRDAPMGVQSPQMRDGANPARKTKIGSVVAALLLAALSLGTFAMLQGLGPESALRRFHQHAANGEFEQAYGLTIGSSAQQVAYVAESINRYAQARVQFQISEKTPTRSGMIVRVDYTFPNGLIVPAYWVLEHNGKGGAWRVNVARTLEMRMR